MVSWTVYVGTYGIRGRHIRLMALQDGQQEYTLCKTSTWFFFSDFNTSRMTVSGMNFVYLLGQADGSYHVRYKHNENGKPANVTDSRCQKLDFFCLAFI